jgi:hypothetical protein
MATCDFFSLQIWATIVVFSPQKSFKKALVQFALGFLFLFFGGWGQSVKTHQRTKHCLGWKNLLSKCGHFKNKNKNPRLNLANLVQFFSQKNPFIMGRTGVFSAWQVAKN